MDFTRFDADNADSLNRRQTLFKRAFPETVGTPTESLEHYRWKFHSKPGHTVSAYEYIAQDGGETVGYYAAIPYAYHAFGKTIVAGMVCDVMTDPAHQGKGIFTKLGRFSTDDLKTHALDCTTGYPIRPEVIPGHLKVGWKALFELPLFVRPAGTATLPGIKKLPSFVHGLTRALISGVLRFLESGRGNGRFEVNLSVIPESLAGDRYQSFLREWMSQQPLSLQKTLEFLKWRLSAPSTKYRLVTVSEGGRLCALIISRVVDLKGVKTLALLDWMELESARVPRGLISKIFRQVANEEKADLIAIMANRTLMQKRRGLRIGFVPSPIKFTFILKNLSLQVSDDRFSDEAHWHLTWIDSDDL